MDNQFTPGQYVRVRGTIHEPWQVRIFHSWNERRPGSGAVPYARVMLKDGFQYDKDAATESFSMIEAWVPDVGQWVWEIRFDAETPAFNDCSFWRSIRYESRSCELFYYGGFVAPLTLPPFVAVGDKY